MKKNIIIFILLLLPAIGMQAQSLYDVNADPFSQIKTASNKAMKDGKHILVMIGGDWCIWCKAFDKLVTSDTSVSNTLHQGYEMVHVSYTKQNKNEAFLATYKQPQRMGFPVFLVLDAKGELLHTQNSAYLEAKDGRKGHDPKLVKDFLQTWAPNYWQTHTK